MRRGLRSAHRAVPDTEGDVRDEIAHHIRETVDLLVAEGWDEDAALSEAERRFGSCDETLAHLVRFQRRRRRRAGSTEWLRSVLADLRFAIRQLRRNPSFTGSIVATLALAGGAATAVFAVVDAVLLRPLPYRDADRLVELQLAPFDFPALDPVRYRVWREAAASLFEEWMAFYSLRLTRTDGDAAEAVDVLAVTPGAGEALGLNLVLGRWFDADDGRPGSSDVVILARAYFDRLGGDASLVGRTIRLETGPATVVGVLREDVRVPDFGPRSDLWIPIRDDLTAAGRPIMALQTVWARIPLGSSVTAAQDAIDRLAAALDPASAPEGGWAIDLVPLADRSTRFSGPIVADTTRTTNRSLALLSGTVAAILLIAVMNGLNLGGMRTLSRSRELAIRTSVGASRARLLRQFAAEGVVLGALAAALAAAVAWLSLSGLVRLVPDEVELYTPFALGLERRTMTFAVLVSLFAGLTVGAIPGVGMLPRSRLHGLSSTADRPTASVVRRAFVVAQLGLSLLLVAGSTLFASSFVRLNREDAGFDYARLAVVDLLLSPARYPSPPDWGAFRTRFEEALEAHPAVADAAASSFSTIVRDRALQTEGAEARDGQPTLVPSRTVTSDYLAVTGIPLVAGRSFGSEDVGRDVAIVDRDLSQFLWGTDDALGRRFRVGDGRWREVVGVVADLRILGRDQREGPHQVLYPMGSGCCPNLTVFVRSRAQARDLIPVIREVLRAVDPEQPIQRLETAAEVLAEPEQTARLLAILMTLLAALGMATAAVGTFGVLAYSVRRREREIGVRKALGAEPSRLVRMVLREGLLLGFLGLAGGIATMMLLGDAVTPLLYDIDPSRLTFVAAPAAVLLVVITVASMLPARRAASIDPVRVLHTE
jgi:putative ABC transport system permease protein